MKLPVDEPLSTSYRPSTTDMTTAKDTPPKQTYRFSKEGSSRGASTLKKAAASLPADAILLANGRPRWDLYPWLSTFRHHGAAPSLDIVGPSSSNDEEQTAVQGGDANLLAALNYGPATGLPALQAFLATHVSRIHSPPSADWTCSITCGTTSALDILLRMFCERGDAILAERYTYTGLLEAARPLGIRVHGVGMDGEGILPGDLDDVLREWDEGVQGRRPGLLYVIPTGQNPTGRTQSAARRAGVYEVAKRHGVLIVEDDPYYFLQMGGLSAEPQEFKREGNELTRKDEKSDAEAEDEETRRAEQRAAYLASLPPSYLSLDTHGIVLRLDSASKIVAPGLRIGWLTGPAEIVSIFKSHSEFSTEGPSGVAQLALHSLLVRQWGQDGFLDWLGWLSASYRERRDTMLAACRRWLPGDVCRWDVPTAGMFLWMSVDVESYNARRKRCGEEGEKSSAEIEEEIAARAMENGVLVSKGSWFTTDGEDSSTRQEVGFRLTYGAAAFEDLEEGIRRFGVAICGSSK